MHTDCNTHNPSIDVSGINYPGDYKNYPTWEKALKISICVSIELVAILGNVLVIIIVLQSKKMRTVTNYYIINLSISDLLVACFPIWMHLVDDLTQGWVMGSFLCKFNPFMQITVMCVSVFTLVSIAGDRFFAIMFPLKSRVTQRKVSVIIIIIWLAAIAIGMPVLFMYTYSERKWKNFVEKFCTEVWPQIRKSNGECDVGITSRRAYWLCVLVVLNWIPMVLMMIAYTVILIRLKRSRVVPRSGRLAISPVQQRSKQKVVKMLFTILIVFIICAIPFQISKIFEMFRDLEDPSQELPDWYRPYNFAAVILLYTNSALNPVLYGGLNENFRSGFKGLINSIFYRKKAYNNSDINTRNSLSRLSIDGSRRESQINILQDISGRRESAVSFSNRAFDAPSSS